MHNSVILRKMNPNSNLETDNTIQKTISFCYTISIQRANKADKIERRQKNSHGDAVEGQYHIKAPETVQTEAASLIKTMKASGSAADLVVTVGGTQYTAPAASMGEPRVSRVVEDDRLMAEAHEAAAQLANGPQQAYGRIKHLLNSSLSASLEAQMQTEAGYLARSAEAPDGQEGISAFLNKQPPQFTE